MSVRCCPSPAFGCSPSRRASGTSTATSRAVSPTRGNDVPDAHLAAPLRQHDVPTLSTNDRDFLRFGFLKVRNPFEETKG